MVTKEHVISATSRLCEATGITPILSWRYGGCGSILTLHRVVDNFDRVISRGLYCSVHFLEELIAHFLRTGWDIIPVQQVLSRIQSQTPNKFVAITFDDGYRDNLERALPVFRKYNVPLSIYVTSGMVQHTLFYWWRCLEEMILRKDVLDIACLGGRTDLSNLAAKQRAMSRLTSAYHSNQGEARRELEILFEREGIFGDQLLEQEALDEGMVRELARAPNVEIGGHTESHPHLASLPEDDARAEIQRNKDYLESLIDRDVRHFAYPFGSKAACGLREFAMVRDLGFATAVTTRQGNLFPKHADTPTALPRIGLCGCQLDISELRLRMSGARQLARRYFSPVVVD